MNPYPSAAASLSSYAAANRLLAQRGRSFHWARRLLSNQHAERATRLYAFCRRIDDLADEASDPALARSALQALRLTLQNTPLVPGDTADLLALLHHSGMGEDVPLDLIRGVESDLDSVRMQTVDELLGYCYQVAGTVGLMMTAMLDVTAPEALPHAVDLGIAMQLTNICRDVKEDAAMGRRYLPASLVGALEPAEMVDPSPAVRAQVGQALAALLDLADQRYASGERGMRHLPAGARNGIRVAARCYQGIGTVLRQRDFDCWSSRASVGTVGKAAITLRALAGAARPPRGEDETRPLFRVVPLLPCAADAATTQDRHGG